MRTHTKFIRIQTNVAFVKQNTHIWPPTTTSLRNKAMDVIQSLIAVAATIAGSLASDLLHDAHTASDRLLLTQQTGRSFNLLNFELQAFARVQPRPDQADRPLR